jgi:hypothetical protein
VALERHVVELSARDQLSGTLDKVGRAAKDAGDKAEAAGKRASRSTADWNRAASALGAGLGLAFGAAIKLANDSEVVQSRLQQSVENTGVAYDSLKDKIDAAAGTALSLGFDDEDALNALNTLTNASGDAEQALRDLAIAEDVARGMGVSLGQAANVIAAAETGRIGNLRRMGIAIDENATKEEALAALQKRFAGQAEQYASTNAATWDRFGNSVENALEALGAKLADVQGPLIALGGAGAAIGPLGDAFEALGGKAKLAQLGTSALNLALGPVGLIGFAATAAAGIAYLALTQDDAATAADLAADANAGLTNSLADQATQLDRLGLLSAAKGATDFLQSMIDDAPEAEQRINDLNKAYEGLVTSGRLGRSLDQAIPFGDKEIQQLDEYTRQVIDANDANHDGLITATELRAALDSLVTGFALTGDEITTYSEAFNEALKLASRTDLDGAKIISDLNGINQAVRDGTMTAAEGEQAIRDLTAGYAAYSTVLDGVTEAQQKTIDSLNDLAEKGLANARKRLADLATQLGVMPDLLDAMAESGNAAAIAARNLSDSSATLDTMTRVIIGNTDAIGQNSASLAEWADGMKGTGADADALNTILEANASIQADILAIQAKQAPLLADLAQAQAEYIDGLSKLPADEQLAALAMMDSATAAQAQELAMLAASAAAGELGAEGTKMAESLIVGAAQANPGLAAVLENIGLINETDGVISVNFPNATNLADTLQSLQTAITDLVTATYMLIVAADPDDAFTDIASVKAAVEGLPDGTVKISADTTSFWNMIGGIPQIVGDRYVNVHGVGFYAEALGGVSPWPDTAALGRVSSGNMTLVGEHGPELVNLPGGALVTPNHATRSMTGRGGMDFSGSTFNFYGVQNPQQFMRQMRDYASTMSRS